MKKIIFFVIVTLLYSGACVAGKRFTLVTVNFPPFYGEEMLNDGWVSDIVKSALEAKGYEVDIRFLEWKKALDETQKGYYDALLGAYFTRERADHYYFSAPIAQTRTGFFKKKEIEISFKELEDLKSFKIGVVEGYATSNDFDAADYFEKVKVKNLDEGLKKLYNNEIDLMADSRAVGKDRLKILENEIPGISQKIEFIKPVLAMNKLYVAVSKNATNAYRKLMDFNQGFRKILRNGTYRKIKRKHRGYPRK
ncbi:MAG: transporter substrate-binding domain-containing protein [Candidatus Parabeggiatoa sp.]|nr:transporter substrate-binding domain-containing protein [Candidatus Parabeggiatoa sp.]